MKIGRRQRWGVGVTALIACTAAGGSMPGCNVVGFIGQAFPAKTKAVYQLEDRPTLILVEDRRNRFDDPTIPPLIAHQVGEALVEHNSIETTIAPEKVDEVLAPLGDDAGQAGVDQIGRAVGADQVIYIFVESMRLQPTPGLLQPTATVRVQVIDAVGRNVLFPTSPGAQDEPEYSTAQGHRVTVELLPRGAGDTSRSTDRAMELKLAERVARDVARLFHDYMPRQPGQAFE